MTEERDVLSAETVRQSLDQLKGILRLHVIPADDALDALLARLARADQEILYTMDRGDHLVYRDEWEAFDRWQRSDAEAELVETRRERDEVWAMQDKLAQDHYFARAEAAEAERDEARADAEALERMGRSYSDLWRQEKAEVARLREALWQIGRVAGLVNETPERDLLSIATIARAALSVPVSTPNSQKEETA